jgi:hypothetical protein
MRSLGGTLAPLCWQQEQSLLPAAGLVVMVTKAARRIALGSLDCI